MGLENILSLFNFDKKETVYLSITPGVGLELIQLDYATNSVKNYAYKELAYNESLRQITDMEAFRTAITDLFAELQLSIKNCNIVLNLPMVLFGSKELPLLLGDDAVTEALTSEVEQSYIFKRYEPIVNWSETGLIQAGDTRKLFYTALQKNTIEDIKNVLKELGANLTGIEISLVSILKALAFSGITNTQMQDNNTWNLMLINPNGYSLCSMVGKNIVDYYEEPLAMKSFEGDDIYNAINASAQITLMSYPANSLLIISETDMVSAELLASKLQIDGNVEFIENNIFKKQNIVPVSLEVLEDKAQRISLEAIGIAAESTINMPFSFSFIDRTSSENDGNEPVTINIGKTEISISPNMAQKLVLILAAILIIPLMLVLFVFLPATLKQKEAQLNDVTSRLEQIQTEINKFDTQTPTTVFDVNSEIKKVLSDNRAKLMAYTALGEAVPKNLWLTYFSAKDDGKIDIKGESTNVEDIYTFYKNMKDSLINIKLRLHKLEMKSTSVDEAVNIDSKNASGYEFEITNMTDTELNPPESNPQDTPPDAQNNPPQEQKPQEQQPPLQELTEIEK